jgi:predicted nucleic acid-binding protein
LATITFLDANVLIAAHHGQSPTREQALAVVNDPTRTLVVSPFLYLEVIPFPVYHGLMEEVEFLKNYYHDGARILIQDLNEIVRIAQEEATRCWINPLDALHVAVAYIAGADVLITLEKKPAMYRATLVRVAHLSTVA